MQIRQGLVPEDLLAMLAGGDRRSIGRVAEVVRLVQANPRLASVLVRGLVHADPLVRMRSADALEKASADRPGLLGRFECRLFDLAGTATQQEVRWHMAQMLPRLCLGAADRGVAVRILTGYLADRSRIVQACALDALGELAQEDARLCGQVLPRIEAAIAAGSPAVRARARQIRKKLHPKRKGGPCESPPA